MVIRNEIEKDQEIEQKILEILHQSDFGVTKRTLATTLGISLNRIQRVVNSLTSDGRIYLEGYGRSVKIYANNNDNAIDEEATDFKKITNENQLRYYLKDLTRRLQNTDMICQYTSLDSLIAIISHKEWYIGSPQNMNDGVELKNGLNRKHNVFFSSFMADDQESIAMWGLYAQPWKDGVRISIPKKYFTRWINDIEEIYIADPKSKQRYSDRKPITRMKADIYGMRVAYVNQDINKKSIHTITCGGAENTIMKDISDSNLIGFIKDSAWSYEKEIRMRVDISEKIMAEGISIDIPDYIIHNMSITLGPRFEGDFQDRIKNLSKVKVEGTIKKSRFYKLLNYIPCDRCQSKQNLY